VTGDRLGSTELGFRPHTLRAGDYRFDVGAIRASAGSVTLLGQAVLLPLALASAPSRLTLVGGTHVPWSPPAHYLAEVFLPALADIGVEAELVLRRWGWYPAGSGEVELTVRPARRLAGFGPKPPGASSPVRGLSAVSRLPRAIAERQQQRVLARLGTAGIAAEIAIQEDRTAVGPGTLVFLSIRGRAGFSALGRRGLPAEQVADDAVDQLLAFRGSGAAVDDHLADQLVPFLALARSPSDVRCPLLSPHLESVAWVVEQVLGARVELDAGPPARVRVTPVGGP
jgi:RNA 3'-terminal phosphate cyclase (ATP)